MHIKNIKIKNFRNYSNIDYDFDNNVNIIIGDNAQGKTNLIEAIYLSVFGRSFRTRKDIETIKFNEDEAVIISSIVNKINEELIEIRIRKEGKYVKSSGKVINKMIDLIEKAYIVVFSPEDLKIVKDSPDKRRKFIDQELSKLKPSYYEDLVNYKKVLKQRNAYLKSEEIQIDILSIWDDSLSYYGNRVIEKRKSFIEYIEKISRKIHSGITDGKELLSIEYEPDIKGRMEDEIDQEKDIINRTTNRGPHKDDIKIIINGIDIRYFGSQGQQRTAALSLKLAELEIIREISGENAILLLDDVLSELDISRQEYLINSIKDIQVFITTAELSELLIEKMPESRIIKIKSGNIIE